MSLKIRFPHFSLTEVIPYAYADIVIYVQFSIKLVFHKTCMLNCFDYATYSLAQSEASQEVLISPSV